MFLRNGLLLVLPFGLITSATPFQPTENSAVKLSKPPSLVKSILPSNASVLSLDLSRENKLNVHCDGGMYGYNPNILDCEGAKEYLVPDTRIWTFGDRDLDSPAVTVQLPYRLMGDRGLCYIQAIIIGDHETAHASINMLRKAGTALFLQCATGATSQGGIATNIGGDNNLAVVLGTYQLPVSCRGALESWDSCRDLLFEMPADKVPQVFGPRGDPMVKQDLPYRLPSSDMKCVVTLFSTGKSDVTSYYDIWEAVTAVFSVCARHRRTGSVRGLGEHGDIFLTMA